VKKRIDKSPSPSLESFFDDNINEVIPRKNIVKFDEKS
jgi:hypothetical protein